MKTKELVELVKEGARPIIKINDANGVLEGPDHGMYGRIVGVGDEDIWERGISTMPFIVDFLEFTEQNKSFAVHNWYDKNGHPTLTWMEMDRYEKDAKNHVIYEMYTDNSEYSDVSHLEIVSDNKWMNEYLDSKSEMSYVVWLENKLTEISNSK